LLLVMSLLGWRDRDEELDEDNEEEEEEEEKYEEEEEAVRKRPWIRFNTSGYYYPQLLMKVKTRKGFKKIEKKETFGLREQDGIFILLLDLPWGVLVFLLTEWLEMKETARLDSAMSCREGRIKLLSPLEKFAFKEAKNLTLAP